VREEDGQWVVHGDPTEGALVALARKLGLDRDAESEAWRRTDVIPFESEHRFMATLHHHDNGDGAIYVKGAPERILDLCEGPIDRDAWEQRIEALAAAGYRTIAVASREFPKHASALSFPEVEAGGFTLLGVFGLLDPSREEAIAAVEACREAGIGVKMITGDHAATARAVARQIGVPGEAEVLTGRRLDAMSDAELADAVRKVDVYARTTPEHKLRLVQALQGHGEVVAMTGDGVNDAPALKRADVGIAMGRRGTEAAKEAAEMVLADDNFASIAKAVRAGRTVYDNLKKAILFILPTNGGEALTILIAILLGTTLPITPVQILWVNMITAVTLALALAFEGAEPDVMTRPPRRRDEPILSRFLVWRIVMVSLLLVVATFGLFQLARDNGASLEEARTIAVNMLVAGEIVYLFNSRVIHAPAWTRDALRTSGPALISVAVVVAFQMLFTYWSGMQTLFGTAALGIGDWLHIVAAALLLFLLVEGEKAAFRRAALRHRQRTRLTSAGAR
jgi:Ca2+-transporting ATPase